MRVPNAKTPLVNIPGGQGQDKARRLDSKLGTPRTKGMSSDWAFGAKKWEPIIKGTEDVSRAVQAITIDVLRKQDEAAVNDAYTRLGEGLNDFLHGENGIYTRHGSNAMGSAESLKQYFDDNIPKLSEGMGENARTLFAQKTDALRIANAKSVATHEAQELQTWRFDSLKGSAQTNKNLALSSFLDDKVFHDSAGKFVEDLTTMASIKGMSAEGTKALLDREMSALTLGRVGLIAQAGDIMGAFELAQNSNMLVEDKVKANEIMGGLLNNALITSAKTNPVGTLNSIVNRQYQTGDPNTPRGIGNNNPFNLEFNEKHQWDGRNGHDGRFARFISPEHGIRAGTLDLKNKIDSGLDTIEKILHVYAPKDDNNDTEAYIHFVAKRLGISPDTVLDNKDVAQMLALAEAFIMFENGGNPYHEEQMLAGVVSAITGSKLPENEDFQAPVENIVASLSRDMLNPQGVDDLISPETYLTIQGQARKTFDEQIRQDLDQYMDDNYKGILQRAQELDLELQDDFVLRSLEALPATYREKYIPVWNKDKKHLDNKQKALDSAIAFTVLDKLKERKYSYSESINIAHSLKEKGMSEEGRNKLIEYIDGKNEIETPDNIEALNQLREFIATGEVSTEEDLKSFAFDNSLTMGQTAKAMEFLKDDPLKGLNPASIKKAYRELNNGKAPDDSEDWYGAVIAMWPAGKPYDYSTLKNVMSKLLTEYSYKGFFGGKKRRTLYEAWEKGKLDEVGLRISPEERKEIMERFILAGFEPELISDEDVVRYYREQVIGLPAKDSE